MHILAAMTTTIDIIRQLRALPMTQAEIARRTGIPQPRICRWEAGNVPVGADDALKLRELLAASDGGGGQEPVVGESIRVEA